MIIKYKYNPFKKSRKWARLYAKFRSKFIVFPKLFLPELTNKSEIHYTEIPVIINNFNRVNVLKELIKWLENAGMKNIFIIDNNSKYPPLLEYYKKIQHTVILLGANVGYKSVWDTGLYKFFKDIPYVYTDPDVLPAETVKPNAVETFMDILNEYPEYTKVGFSLKLDDIPDEYPLKKEVLEWESRFWKKELKKDLYIADIDTTFALYRENSFGQQWGTCLRTAGDMTLRHMPWYELPDKPDEEELFYREQAKCSSWYK